MVLLTLAEVVWFLLTRAYHIPFILRLLWLTSPGQTIAKAGEGNCSVTQALQMEWFSFYEFISQNITDFSESVPDLTLDSWSCAVSHLPDYFLLSITCHLNPWALDCCHLYLPSLLAIRQAVQYSVLLWSSEVFYLDPPCSDHWPLAQNLGARLIICYLWREIF